MSDMTTTVRNQGPVEGAERARTEPVFVPATDIYETKDALIVLAELPGADPDTVDVTLENQVLRITARNRVTPPKGMSLVHAEYRTGDYERSFTLSAEIDTTKIEASVRNGLLQLTLPKVGGDPARKIAVKAG